MCLITLNNKFWQNFVRIFLSAGENLAMRGRAVQSSVNEYGMAFNAIDGNHATNPEEGSCSRTNSNIGPWWRLDLGKTYKVFSLRITNSDTLEGAEIRIGDSLENNGNNNPM